MFVSYLLYGFLRPFISRAWRREIEEDEEDDEHALHQPRRRPKDRVGTAVPCRPIYFQGREETRVPTLRPSVARVLHRAAIRPRRSAS